MAKSPLLLFILFVCSGYLWAFVVDEGLRREQTTEGPSPNTAHLPTAIPTLNLTADAYSELYDAVVVVADSVARLSGKNLDAIRDVVQANLQVDQYFGTSPGVTVTSAVPSTRLVYVSTGKLDGDDNDVRQFASASSQGIARALNAGSRRPLLVCLEPGDTRGYSSALFVAILGILQSLYQPLSVRMTGKQPPVDVLGVWHEKDQYSYTREVVRLVRAFEPGRVVARDVCMGDPEAMAPPKVDAYLQQIFNDGEVSITTADSQSSIEQEFPLVAAVNRASRNVSRHHARVIKLSYKGPGEVKQTLLFAGKGVTYDSGGLDIKYGGRMYKMSCDKCGAASVAGIVMTLSLLKPAGLHVIAALPMVRNGVGAEGYASDEVITGRSGVSVRIKNTDAEGRLILADVLSLLKDIALNATNPYIISIATLTGHAVTSGGYGYSMLMDNGPAFKLHTALGLQKTGDMVGDPFELSRLRREDFSANKAASDPEAVLVSLPDSPNRRGHQKAAAFLLMASGLDKHGSDANQSLPFSHVDIAGPASGSFPRPPPTASVVAVSSHFGLTTEEKRLLGLLPLLAVDQKDFVEYLKEMHLQRNESTTNSSEMIDIQP